MNKTQFITFPITSQKIPKIKGFQNITESVKSGLFYGIQCGIRSNLTVIDIDVKDAGLERWNELIKDNGEIATAIVKTPSGGLHYYFNHIEGLKNSVKVDGVGIDVRTTGGFVCGFSSKNYNLISDIQPIDMPEWLFQFVKPKEKAKLPDHEVQSTNELDDMITKALEFFNDTSDAPNHGGIKKVCPGLNSELVITLKRLGSSHCDLCNKSHDCDNTVMLLIYPDDEGFKVMLGCCKSPGTRFLGRVGEPVKKLVENSIQKNIDGIMTEDLTKRYARRQIDFKTHGFVIEFELEYCSDSIELMECNSEILAIRSGTGTGKTNAIAKIQKEKPMRVIVSTFRVGQVGQLKGDKYKEIEGLVAYNEKDADGKKIKINNNTKAVIIQMESFYRIDMGFNKKSHQKSRVIFDEAEQIKKQLTSETFMKQPTAKRSWEIFKQIVKHSTQIVIMDAHLTPETLAWFKNIRGGTPSTSIFINTWQKENTKEIDLVPSTFDVLNDISEKLKDKKKVYVACNGSIEKIEAYAEIMRNASEPKLNILVVHRETLSNPEVHEALQNINETWGEYDGIITSPSIQSGLSYDVKNKFFQTYGIFGNYTSSSNDCIQMLDRVRHTISQKIMISIDTKNNNPGALTESDITNSLKSKTHHIQEIQRQLETVVDYTIDGNGNNVFSNTDYYKTYVENIISANLDKKFFLYNFLRTQRESGFKLNAPLNNMNDTLIKVWRKLVNGIIDAQKTQNAKLIADVIHVSETEIEKYKLELNRGNSITPQQSLSLKKDIILKTYNVEAAMVDALEPDQKTEWYEKYGDKKVRKCFVNQRKVFQYDTFKEVLAELKQREMNRSAPKPVEFPDDPDEAPDIIDLAITAITTRYSYAKWCVLLGWLKTLGFTSLNSTCEFTKEQLLPALVQIKSELTETQLRQLDKDPRKLKGFQSLDIDDSKIFKKMVDFINGSLKEEFGVSITQKKQRGNYILKNDYLTDGFPQFTLKDDELPHIPKLKRETIIEEPVYEPDGYDSDDGSEIDWDN